MVKPGSAWKASVGLGRLALLPSVYSKPSERNRRMKGVWVLQTGTSPAPEVAEVTVTSPKRPQRLDPTMALAVPSLAAPGIITQSKPLVLALAEV